MYSLLEILSWSVKPEVGFLPLTLKTAIKEHYTRDEWDQLRNRINDILRAELEKLYEIRDSDFVQWRDKIELSVRSLAFVSPRWVEAEIMIEAPSQEIIGRLKRVLLDITAFLEF